MKKPIAVCSILFLLILVACSNFIRPNPTTVPTLTLTAVPELTLISTPFPPTGAPDAVVAPPPEGQPAAEWKGIPIMPGAIAGEGDDESYVFTVQATPQQVQEYYQLELGKLGWQPSATGDGDSSLTLIFTNEASATLTISLIAKGHNVLVLLVK